MQRARVHARHRVNAVLAGWSNTNPLIYGCAFISGKSILQLVAKANPSEKD